MKTFNNPILPGFYPDPSVCRVGDDYYLVTSTFAYFPGVPVFKSKDLVHWEQIGNILTGQSQLPLENAEVSRGIFAPTIRYNDGVFYMITTNVSFGGNFLVTATDPAGEWSEPYYLSGADGIDPSLFFENGRCWYHGTCEKKDKAYFGDNEIYLQELDLEKMQLVGERYVIWHSALKDAAWPEAPHIYKKNDWYYLLISEGGTCHDHAITVARSKTLTGYYEGFKCNPILTHRHLGKNYPIVNVGHGDLVETQNGEWWMVLLASRPYGGRFRNLGRETFLVPVSWENDWPVVNYGIGLLREEEKFPDLPVTPIDTQTSFDFRKLRDIPLNLMHLRNPVREHYKLDNRGLVMRLNKNAITELETVSYLCIRQMHKSFEVRTKIEFSPASENESAGLVIFQSHKYNFQFVLTGKNFLRVIKTENENQEIISETQINSSAVFLKISAQEQNLSFLYSTDGEIFTPIHENASANILSTDIAGGFVGNTIGMYAFSNGAESENYAVFAEFSYNRYPTISITRR
ncbi:MAG: glycoside hydrolase family 43 protein [Defluviitaleaceae bacterium]|nr:glycoside hydrolase family 43 protein [Defluviitaleaceae bacterium]